MANKKVTQPMIIKNGLNLKSTVALKQGNNVLVEGGQNEKIKLLNKLPVSMSAANVTLADKPLEDKAAPYSKQSSSKLR